MAGTPIQVRFDDVQLARIDRAAAAVGLSRSAWLRALAEEAITGEATGKVERSGDGRQRGGIAMVIRPARATTAVPKPTRRTGHDTRTDRCPRADCGALTYSSARGKRKCQACGWEGPA